MATLNRVEIIGNLGKSPELQQTKNGRSVAALSVATNHSWKDADGERQEKTEWHRVVVWGKQAEACCEYLAKGRQVFVSGRLTTRSYTHTDGGMRYVTEIVAENVQFLGGSRNTDSSVYESSEDHSYEEASVSVG